MWNLAWPYTGGSGETVRVIPTMVGEFDSQEYTAEQETIALTATVVEEPVSGSIDTDLSASAESIDRSADAC